MRPKVRPKVGSRAKNLGFAKATLKVVDPLNIKSYLRLQ